MASRRRRPHYKGRSQPSGLKPLVRTARRADTHFVRGSLRNRPRGVVGTMIAVTMLIGTAALIPPASASPAKSHPKVVVATGSVTCSKISGSISFHPAEHHVGTAREKITFVFRASHCVTSGSNVKNVTSGYLSEVVTRPDNACASGLYSQPLHATGTWTAKNLRLRATTGKFSGFDFVCASNGDVGLVIPNKGGSAQITGSFAGSNHGATSTAVSYMNLTATQVRAACLSSQGLSSLKFTGGRVTFS